VVRHWLHRTGTEPGRLAETVEGLIEPPGSFVTVTGRAEELLAAPLGRQLVCATLGFTTFELYDRCGLGSPPGTAMLTRRGGIGSGGVRRARRTHWSDVPADEACQVIREMVAGGRWQTVSEMSELELLSWIAGETGSFGFRGEDEWLWGLTAMAADELIPVAERLLNCPAARKWWRPMVAEDQRIMAFDGYDAFLGHDLRAAISESTRLHKEDNATRAVHRPDETERQRDEAAGIRYGAHWWSTPKLRFRTESVGPFEGIPSIELLDFVDSGSLAGVATVIGFACDTATAIYEVNEPRDWGALVERYPMDVTGTHDGEWRYWGGVRGPWLLPDWAKVADDYSGIHVTIGGYLSTSGRALAVGTGYTMLAGWVPDGTVWLADTSTRTVHLGEWNFSAHGAFHPSDDNPLRSWTPA
jgi:hypothetical protein